MSEVLSIGELRLAKRPGVRYKLSQIPNNNHSMVMLHVDDMVGKRSAMFTIDALHFPEGVAPAEVKSAQKQLLRGTGKETIERSGRTSLLGMAGTFVVDNTVTYKGTRLGNVAIVCSSKHWMYFVAAHFDGRFDAPAQAAWSRFLKILIRVS